MNYAPASIRNYHREVRFFLEFIPDVPPLEIKTQHVIDYFYFFLRTEYNVKWWKVYLSAQSIRFLFVRVFQKPLAIPKSIYPCKEYKLPMVMSRAEVQQLFSRCLKEKGKKIDYMVWICIGGLHTVGQQELKWKLHWGFIFDVTFCMGIFVKPA